MSLYSNQKWMRGSKKNWKKESTKLIWKQMGQERTKEESLFKVKEAEQKQEKNWKNKVHDEGELKEKEKEKNQRDKKNKWEWVFIEC